SKAFSMTRVAPASLSRTVEVLISEFRAEMPKFIVDTRKHEIPTSWPALELWPLIPKGMLGSKKTMPLPPNEKMIAYYDSEWIKLLRDNFGAEEAQRYEAMKPLREFVMEHYKIVNLFGEHLLLQLKNPTEDKEQ
ncbi:MAG: hypothetical protein ACYST9_07395, partial [Planctomycetota bacterium]